jgi:predicted RNase H-like HicB family nuclease
MTYSEFRFYSPLLDSDAARVSMTNSRNEEFFMIVPYASAVSFRAKRDEALEAIEEAITLGLDAGEVRIVA